MLIPEIALILKDGRRAILRSPRREDAPKALACITRCTQETDFLSAVPEEFEGMSVEEEERFLMHQANSEHIAMLVCFVEGKYAGHCDISFSTKAKTRHRATVGIALTREYWGLGIGTRMFEEMIRIAQSRRDVTQLELEVIQGNSRAIALYEKMGFRLACVHPRAFRLPNGCYQDEYLMIRDMM